MVQAALTRLTGVCLRLIWLSSVSVAQMICFFCFFIASSSVNKCKFNDMRQMEESDKLAAADHQTQGCDMSYHCSDYWAIMTRQLTSSPNLYILHRWYWSNTWQPLICAIKTLLGIDWRSSLSGLKDTIPSDFCDFKCFWISCLTFDGMSMRWNRRIEERRK